MLGNTLSHRRRKHERFNTTLPHILTGLYLNCVGKDIQENAMTEKLKKCPFCGGEVNIYSCHSLKRHYISHNVEDRNCPFYKGIEIDNKDQSEAIEAWNRRAE